MSSFREAIAVLFDLDGVLVDTEPLKRRAWEEALTERGLPAEPLADPGWHGRTEEDVLRWYEERTGLSVERPLEIVAAKRRIHLGFLARAVPWIPGMPGLLRRLHGAGRRLALVTGSDEEQVRAILSSAPGLADAFSAIVTGDLGLPGKPDPAPYREALGRLGIPPADAVAVEDSAPGVASAGGAGLPVIALARPPASPPPGVTAVARSAGELVDLLFS